VEKGTGDAAYGCYYLRDKDKRFNETVNSVRGFHNGFGEGI